MAQKTGSPQPIAGVEYQIPDIVIAFCEGKSINFLEENTPLNRRRIKSLIKMWLPKSTLEESKNSEGGYLKILARTMRVSPSEYIKTLAIYKAVEREERYEKISIGNKRSYAKLKAALGEEAYKKKMSKRMTKIAKKGAKASRQRMIDAQKY